MPGFPLPNWTEVADRHHQYQDLITYEIERCPQEWRGRKLFDEQAVRIQQLKRLSRQDTSLEIQSEWAHG